MPVRTDWVPPWGRSGRGGSRRRFCAGLAALLLLPACGYYPKLKPTWRENLAHRDPQIRLEAVVRVTESGEPSAVPDLLRRLDDDDDAVRYYAHIGVKKITGQDHGFRPYADRVDRAAAVRRWWSWYEQQSAESVAGGAPSGTTPAASPAPPGEESP